MKGDSRTCRASWACQPDENDPDQHDGKSNQHPVLERHAKEREGRCQPVTHREPQSYEKAISGQAVCLG